jgi:hypothetical protein
LLADPALGREMGARGRERVEKEFHFETFASSLKHILCELCESRTSRRLSSPSQPQKLQRGSDCPS